MSENTEVIIDPATGEPWARTYPDGWIEDAVHLANINTNIISDALDAMHMVDLFGGEYSDGLTFTSGWYGETPVVYLCVKSEEFTHPIAVFTAFLDTDQMFAGNGAVPSGANGKTVAEVKELAKQERAAEREAMRKEAAKSAQA